MRKGAKIVFAIDEQGGPARQQLRPEQIELFLSQSPDLGVVLM